MNGRQLEGSQSTIQKMVNKDWLGFWLVRIVILVGCCVWVMSLSIVPAYAQGGTIGITWTGAKGITETVGQIMAREKNSPPTSAAGYRTTKPWLNYSSVRPKANQSAPTSSPLLAPNSPRVPSAPRNPQTVGTSFLATTLSESGFIPPDTIGDVGPDQILVPSNGRIKVFDKAGNLGGLNVTTDTFFASVRTAGTSDPHVRYDRLTQRWFVVMIDVATPNRVLIAVSSGPHISSTASFTFYFFQHDLVGTTPNSDTGGFADYPTLGLDNSALYIGDNVFNAAGTAYLGSTGFVVRKSSITSGGPIVVTAFRQIAPNTGAGVYTPQGVNNDDPSATEGYFIGIDYPSQNTLNIRRVSTPGGTPTISGNLSIASPSFALPLLQTAMGSGTRLDTDDSRLFAAAIHKDKITGVNSLWTAHHIAVNSSGVGTSSGDRNGARWYEIGNITTAPTLLQSGTLYDSSVTNPRGYIYPSVFMSGQGHMALGSTFASTNDFAGIVVAGRFRTDATGATQTPTIALTGAASYNVVANGSNRWGDFSQTVIDPNDDQTMWTFQEYANATNSWGVRAIRLIAPPPATPASLNPIAILAGQSSVNVTLTGTSVSGSEFFDPGPDTGGPGYTNHITVTITGVPGLGVNGAALVIPASPSTTPVTQLTLNLNTTAITQGCYNNVNITVTNPDGQSASTASPLSMRFGPAWIGGAGNNNWSNASNWAPVSVPNGTQLAMFDPNCSNTSSIVDSNQTVGAVTILSGYSGTITEGTSNLTINGNLTQQGGTVTGGTGTITVGGNFNLTGGTFTAPSNSLVLNGNFANSATFNANGGTATFSGATAQTIGGSVSTIFNTLTINNTSSVTLTNSTTVNGALALNTGNLFAGTNTNQLNLGCSGTVSSAGGGDVIGDAVRNCSFVTGTTYAFNNPNTSLTFTNGTPPTSVTINLAKIKPSQLTTAIPRTYTITPTGGNNYTATLQLRYANGSELTGMTEADLKLWRFDGTRYNLKGGTDQPNATNPYVSLAGVAQFSPWAITDNGSPTAVTLASFGAHPENQMPSDWMIPSLLFGIAGTLAMIIQLRRNTH